MNSLLLIGILLKNLGKVEGRKKLQKIVHILQEFGVPFGFRYGFLHYGPYSEDLNDQMRSLRHDHLVTEEPVQGIFPTSRFTALPKFEELLNAIGVVAEPEWTPLARELNKRSPRELEAVSTLLYLEKTSGPEERRDQEFEELKPALTSQLPMAKALLNRLRQDFCDVA